MAHAKVYSGTIATIADGSATGYVEVEQGGQILAVIYTKVDYDAGVDFVITSDQSGQIILDADNVDASATFCPRQATHLNTTGAAMVYAATDAVGAPIVIPPGRIKIVIAAGGNVKTGTFKFVVGSP